MITPEFNARGTEGQGPRRGMGNGTRPTKEDRGRGFLGRAFGRRRERDAETSQGRGRGRGCGMGRGRRVMQNQ